MTRPVLIALHRIGPYHFSRFLSASTVLDVPLVVLQTRPNSQEYPWEFNTSTSAFKILNITGSLNPESDPPTRLLHHQLSSIIFNINPSAIFTVGWGDRTYLQLLSLSYRHKIPISLISDSRHADMPRSIYKEYLKSQLLLGYSSALVAGTESRDYLCSLKYSDARIFQPWDVVDCQIYSKDLFTSIPSQSDANSPPPFLCVSRFIPEKNHQLLIRAYQKYQLLGGRRPLLLVGDGPIKSKINLLLRSLPLPHLVSFKSFMSSKHLAKLYHTSHALILSSLKDTWGLVVNEAIASGLPVIVSSACGCSIDLIEHRVSGWVFSSGSDEELLTCLCQADQLSSELRQQLTTEAKLKLRGFTLQDFSVGLAQAYNYALSHSVFSFKSFLTSSLLTSLT